LCDNDADDCEILDNQSGLIWSESFPVSGAAAAVTTLSWSNTITHCNGLNYANHTNWRVPTQMELNQAYTHGIREIGNSGGTNTPGGDTTNNNKKFISNVDGSFWSASTISSDTSKGWKTSLHKGHSQVILKTGLEGVICVR
jgi:hypothetical protein